MTLQATQNQRRPEQKVSVAFTQPAISQRDWLSSQGDEAGHQADDESGVDGQNKESLAATVSDRSNGE
jgi:hypothetical protein